MERNNRVLGDSLRALLITGGQEEWDSLLPHLMRTFRGTPNTTTGETANFMMLGWELRLPDQLIYDLPTSSETTQSQYVSELQERLRATHELLRDHQQEVPTTDSTEPLLFKSGDLVWLENKRRKKGENPKLQPKYVGPYEGKECRPNHTYLINRSQQDSWQNEGRLKLFRPCREPAGQAPLLLEPRRRRNMKGKTRDKPQ